MEYLILSLTIVLLVVAVLFFFWQTRRTSTDGSALLSQQMEAMREQLRLTLESSSKQIGDQLDGHRNQWQQTHQTVSERLDNAAKVVGDLNGRMIRVEETAKQVLEVGKDLSSLQQILKAPKLRGNLSEQFLGDLLAQMLPQESFELQYSFKNGSLVDAIVKTAQGIVPIDAKFPLENFQRLIVAESDLDKIKWRKGFAQDVKKHIQDIAKKYIRPSEGTFDFAMMYIPAENVYYEIMTKDMDIEESVSLVQYAMKKRIIPVSPNSFYAYLNTILLGLKGLQIEKKGRDILNEISRLRNQMSSFREDFDKVGRHLGNALTKFEDSEKRLDRVEVKFEALEAAPVSKEEKEELSNQPAPASLHG